MIRPSYALHARMGILKQTVTGQTLQEDMPFRNFLSGRLLWDEAMGSAAAEWVRGPTAHAASNFTALPPPTVPHPTALFVHAGLPIPRHPCRCSSTRAG